MTDPAVFQHSRVTTLATCWPGSGPLHTVQQMESLCEGTTHIMELPAWGTQG